MTSKNTQMITGKVPHTIMNVIAKIEFIVSHLESNVMWRTFIKAHIQIIENDSLRRVICCDQNREV